MKVEQLYYTSCRRGVLGSPGFQILAHSTGLSTEDRKEISALLTYTPGAELPVVPTAEELARFPTHQGYARLKSGLQVVFQSVYRGAGDHGRLGNYFGHALVLPREPIAVCPAQTDWHPWWKVRAPETEAHVEATGDTTLPCLDIAESSLEMLPGYSVRELAGWLAQEKRMDIAAAMLGSLADRASTKKKLVLLGPEGETKRWICVLQASLPRPWLELASYGTYFPDVSRAPVAIAARGADLGASAYAVQRSAVVIDVGKAPPTGPEVAHPAIVQWLCDRWNNPRANQDAADDAAQWYACPQSTDQFVGGLEWLTDRRVTSRSLDFVKNCAREGGWNEFWTIIGKFKPTDSDAVVTLATFFGTLLSDGSQGQRAWEGIVSLSNEVLVDLAHSGQDTCGPANSLALSAGVRLPALVAELAETDFLQRLASSGSPTESLFDRYLEWIAKCPVSKLGPEIRSKVAHAFSFATEGQVASSAAARWLALMPLDWQACCVAVRLDASSVDALAEWLTASYRKESLNTVIQMVTHYPPLSETPEFEKWLTTIARNTFEALPATAAGKTYLLAGKKLENMTPALRRTLAAILFSAYARAGRQYLPSQMASACLDYLSRSMRDGATPTDTLPVLELLDQTLPVSGKPVAGARQSTLLAILRHAKAANAPHGALTAALTVRAFLGGARWEEAMASFREMAQWKDTFTEGRAQSLASALGMAVAGKRSVPEQYAKEMLRWMGTYLPQGCLRRFVEAGTSSVRGSVGLIPAILGISGGFTPPQTQEMRQALHEVWGQSTARRREKLMVRLSRSPRSRDDQWRIDGWLESLPPPQSLLVSLFRSFTGRIFRRGMNHKSTNS